VLYRSDKTAPHHALAGSLRDKHVYRRTRQHATPVLYLPKNKKIILKSDKQQTRNVDWYRYLKCIMQFRKEGTLG